MIHFRVLAYTFVVFTCSSPIFDIGERDNVIVDLMRICLYVLVCVCVVCVSFTQISQTFCSLTVDRTHLMSVNLALLEECVLRGMLYQMIL